MFRYFAEVAYHGRGYAGWQIQQNARTVQGTLEEALRNLLRQPVDTTGSGRTDTGVHAGGQVMHFELPEAIGQPGQLLFRLNGLLPADIAVKDLYQVHPEAHARFSALTRSYVYTISRAKDPFVTDTAWCLYKELDVSRMQAAAAMLLGHVDFAALSKEGEDGGNTRCRLYEATWEEDGPRLRFRITANRFLRGMVRLIVGRMTEVGTGRLSVEALDELLRAAHRLHDHRMVAPAQGLSLTAVHYPDWVRQTG